MERPVARDPVTSVTALSTGVTALHEYRTAVTGTQCTKAVAAVQESTVMPNVAFDAAHKEPAIKCIDPERFSPKNSIKYQGSSRRTGI